MTKYLLVGLGNVGAEYAGTRHNLGFEIADALVIKHGGKFRGQHLGDLAELPWKGRLLLCLKPSTFMNLSGQAVKYWIDKEKIPLDRLLVLVDDVALPRERIRIRPSGSAAGHNGLQSIQEELGTDAYPRLRLGIGNDYPRGMQVDYVLGRWTAAEVPLIIRKIEKSVEIVESFVAMGITRTMNEFNKIEITL